MRTATYASRIRRNLRGCRPRFSFGLSLFEEGYCLDFFGFLISLPFLDRWAYEPHEIMESWGFTTCDRTIQLYWGRYCKVVYMPWDYQHIKHEVLRADGTWVPFVGSWETGLPIKNTSGKVVIAGGKNPDGRKEETFTYQYKLKSGEVQERTATVFVERREWRWRWFTWFPFFAKKRQCIDVQFNHEVGERTGSWKGGCVGCGYTMRPGESAEMTLRRMERERVFN